MDSNIMTTINFMISTGHLQSLRGYGGWAVVWGRQAIHRTFWNGHWLTEM